MPGVFLSHSSVDKPFVTTLAADLVSRGVPVWLDTWEIETGDSLTKRLLGAIDDTTFVIVALSPASVRSSWVAQELTAALAKEGQLGRKVVLPIKLSDCDIPPAIADRLYADFSSGYLAALERLEETLRKAGAGSAVLPLEQELFPLFFSKVVYLDVERLESRVSTLLPRFRGGPSPARKQFRVVPDPLYDALRAKFLERLEGLPAEATFSTELHQQMRSSYESIRQWERTLVDGIAHLVDLRIREGLGLLISMTADWFARICRATILSRFELALGHKALPDLLPDVEPFRGVLADDKQAARFFGVQEVDSYRVFRRDPSMEFSIWFPEDSEVGKRLRRQAGPIPTGSLQSVEPLYKFLLPQLLARHDWSSSSPPTSWELDLSSDWMID